MSFVPLSADGLQRASTEPLTAPRIQVALRPHETGVAVLAVEPTGLRFIGQLDPGVADGYRRVLAPLAVLDEFGVCVAERTDSGTVLYLGPAESCLPREGWPWRSAAAAAAGADTTAADASAAATSTGPPATSIAETTRLAPAGGRHAAGPGAADTPGTTRPANSDPAGAGTEVVAAAAAATAPPASRPAHARPSRFAGGPITTRRVLACLIGLLLIGATARGLASRTEEPVAAPVAAGNTVSAPVQPIRTPDPTPTPTPQPTRTAAVAAPDPDDDRGRTGSDQDTQPTRDDQDEPTEEPDPDDEPAEQPDDDEDDNEDAENDDDRSDEVVFRSCFSAFAAGAAPIRRGEPGYSRRLDIDGDGVACEFP